MYETHARVALECDDMNEYNQCQTQLKHIYFTAAAEDPNSKLCLNENEFIAYRILYYVYLQGNKKYTKGNSDLSFAMAALTDKSRK